jgi:hypothetical protein
MGWATQAVSAIREGQTVQVRPRGGSMRGRIEDGQLVTLTPVEAAEVREGDAVLVRWRGGYLLHLVKRVQGGRFLIGNNVGRINGWVKGDAILARVTRIGG